MTDYTPLSDEAFQDKLTEYPPTIGFWVYSERQYWKQQAEQAEADKLLAEANAAALREVLEVANSQKHPASCCLNQWDDEEWEQRDFKWPQGKVCNCWKKDIQEALTTPNPGAPILERLRKLEEALEYYANPFAYTRDIPDFYSEMDFGSKAEEALRSTRTEGPTRKDGE